MINEKWSSFPDGRVRAAIRNVQPEIDCGRFPIKRIIGEKVAVEADIFADGHDVVRGLLRYRHADQLTWEEVPLEAGENDRFRGEFTPVRLGLYFYTVRGWVDLFRSWVQDLKKKIAAGQDVSVDLATGAGLVEETGRRASGRDGEELLEWAASLRRAGHSPPLSLLEPEKLKIMDRYPDLRHAADYIRELEVMVDRPRARFGAWYELFPRSCALEPGRHGTFRDCEARLDHISRMGFDVLYLPPIHPIGQSRRKGKNNSPQALPGDPGSPWAIGGKEGGHRAVHPELGTLEDFRRLLARAAEGNLEVALDLAFQCSPDHPYVREHPEWFRWRPDGCLQYAENPPKKYEDIYPFDFTIESWRELWEELLGIVRFWIEQGVRIFRVDNPHTKPFPFWEWLIREVKREHPEVIFLAEAFTRPKVLEHLAKIGFTQSYTYFAWRNTKEELTRYFTELTRTEQREYLRPSLWPNTPDILTEYIQTGGRPAFQIRLVLAATLGASYGIYGPPFEGAENIPREWGTEEYAHSEKYEIRYWDPERGGGLRDFISRLNHIRRENPALQEDHSLRFHSVDNDQVICYSKRADEGANLVLVVVNLDPHHRQQGWVEFPPGEFGLDGGRPFQVHDLLSNSRYLWHGRYHYVKLDPAVVPAHVFRVRRWIRTERDFDYYM